MPVDKLNMGDVIDIFPFEGVTKKHGTNEVICEWSLKVRNGMYRRMYRTVVRAGQVDE